MTDYTPTTKEVRDQWMKSYRDIWGVPGLRTLRKRFDRWLAGVKADAYDEALQDAGVSPIPVRNPYRGGEQ